MAYFGSADSAERWTKAGYNPYPQPSSTNSRQRTGGSPTTYGGSRQKTGAPVALPRYTPAPASAPSSGQSVLDAMRRALGGSRFRTFGGGGSVGTVTLPKPPTYATTPAPLTAEMIRMLDGRRIAANEEYGEAVAYEHAGRERTQRDLGLALQEMADSFRGARTSTGNRLGAAGLALSPASMVPSMHALRDRHLAEANKTRSSAADAVAELARQVGIAKQNRDRILSDIEQQKAVYGADLNQLLPGVNY